MASEKLLPIFILTIFWLVSNFYEDYEIFHTCEYSILILYQIWTLKKFNHNNMVEFFLYNLQMLHIQHLQDHLMLNNYLHKVLLTCF
jgi:hypothetical protein